MVSLATYISVVQRLIEAIGSYADLPAAIEHRLEAAPFMWFKSGHSEWSLDQLPKDTPAAVFTIGHMKPAERQGMDYSTITFELTLYMFEPPEQACRRISMVFSALMRDTGQRTNVEIINDDVVDIVTQHSGSHDRHRYSIPADQATRQTYVVTWTADIENDYSYRLFVDSPPAETVIITTDRDF